MLNVSVRPQPAAVAAVSALAATAGKTSSDGILVEQIAAGSKPAMQALFARHRAGSGAELGFSEEPIPTRLRLTSRCGG